MFTANRMQAAPVMEISASTVAPSPSATICAASSEQTRPRTDANASSSRGASLAPLASRTTASLVEHSPSTEIELKLSSTAGRKNSIASPGSSG